jgi:two-component system response regulator NreC
MAVDIRVLIVDDHAILRDGIRSLLERHGGITVVGEASNGQDALVSIAELRPDVVLMDLSMPEMDGLEATKRSRQLFPDVKILVLTQHDNREYIAPLLRAGAAGYILKRSGGREVVTAIQQVYQQGAFLAPAVARQVIDDYQQRSGDSAPEASRVTVREHEILRMVVDGYSNKDIARKLDISPKTVAVHRTNMMAKFGVQNSAELVRYALQHHLL